MAVTTGAAAPAKTAGSPDKLPSGSWGIGPLNIQWSLKSLTEVDVSVSLFGIDIDDLKATLSGTQMEISDEINLLAVQGTITLDVKYDVPNQNGLWIGGRLQGPGFDTGQMNYRIIPW